MKRQIVVLVGSLTAVIAILLVILVQLLLAGAATSALNRELTGRTQAVIAAADSESDSAGIDVPDEALLPGVAVYDSTGTLVAGSVPKALEKEYAEHSRAEHARSFDVHDAYRLNTAPFALKNGSSGVVVAAERTTAYEAAEGYALWVSIGAGIVMVLLATVSAAWVARRVLTPVGEMARTADEWSANDLDRRFEQGPPTDEFTALANTLDSLMEKVAAAIRSEQRLTSELAHELRTPLTAIRGSADLALMRTDLDPEVRLALEEVLAGSDRMDATMRSLLDLARAPSTQPGGCDAATVAREVVEGAGPTSRVEIADGIAIAAPHAFAVRALAPVVDNAVRLAEEVVVKARREGQWVDLLVEDSGPGVEVAHRERIFEPGQTGRRGPGLGLALSRRIARTLGGDVFVDSHAAVSTFVVRFPKGQG